MDDEIGPVLLVLAAPDELRVEVGVAALVGHPDRVADLLVQNGLVLGRAGCSSAAASSCVRVSTVFCFFLRRLAILASSAILG